MIKKLYELPENQNVKLYFDDKVYNKKDIVVIFDHLDGFYSYCWLENDKSHIIHIKATTQFEPYKDGYKCIEDKVGAKRCKKHQKVGAKRCKR